MVLSRHQNAGQNETLRQLTDFFQNKAQFKYFGTTVTNQNLIQREIKTRLNSGNDCNHSVQNILSSHLLLKNVKIRIFKIIIWLWFCKGLKLGL
jgi:hypothetical protein